MSNYGNGPIIFSDISNVTATPGRNAPELGARTTNNSKDYLYVYYTGSSIANVGLACVVSATSGYSVTVSSTTSADLAMGVVVNTAMTTGDYGWLQTRGYCEVEMITASGTVAAGDLLHLAADGEFAPVSNATGSKDNVIGKAMAAIVSGASGSAYVTIH